MNRTLTGLALLLTACTSTPAPTPLIAKAETASAAVVVPEEVASATLETTTPERAGLDAEALKRLLAEAEETSSDAVVILRDGKLVGEWTFGKPTGRIEAMSITKSVVAMGVGAAIRAGKIPSLDVPAHHYFAEWADGPHAAITLRHLLDNTSGLHAKRTTEDIYASDDFVAFALKAQLDAPPGSVFKYNNRAFNLPPAVVEMATGQSIRAFMQETLFTPLGIEEVGWKRDDAGNCHGMAGLEIAPLDLARLGQLMLDGGVHRGRQLLDAEFVEASLSPSPKLPYYGLGWWLAGDVELVLDDTLFAQWRASGVDEDFIAIVADMKDQPMSGVAFAAAIEKRFEEHGGAQRWHETTWKRGRPAARPVKMLKMRRFAARGYLGQTLVVLPEHRLVAVRMRRGDDRGALPELDFEGFEKRVQALVEAPEG